jgi:hypothetical protein
MCKVLWGCPVIVAQNTTVSDTYRGIGDSIGRYSGILIPGIGGIDRKTVWTLPHVHGRSSIASNAAATSHS